GNLFVVDQLNSRVQIFTPDGEFYDQFGSLGTNFGNFVRPKDVAVDPFGFIYVSDGGLNNLQLFDLDLQLLTFVGSGGTGPGQFMIASGIAVHGDEFAVVDQLNRRVQVFRFLAER
ncbi:MAG: 6-bladed beta-propeller, partial [bacterium]|nr:6-bladed beta-propeller [bacterium]